MRILNGERLADHGYRKGRENMVKILDAGMTAADPYDNMKELVRVEDDRLYVGGTEFEPRGNPKPGIVEVDLKEVERIFVLGAGKGIQTVAKAIEEALGERLTDGHIILKYGDQADLNTIGITHAGHPVPDQNSVKGCEKIVEIINTYKLTEKDVVFTIVGNGVSSLLTMPVESLSLEAVMEVTRILQIEKGATTRDLNHVRNSIDQLKGGRITRMLTPAKMFHILTIDCNYSTMYGEYRGLVEGNIWLHTLPVVSTAKAALNTIDMHDAWGDIAPEIIEYLKNMTSENDCLTKEEYEAMDAYVFGVVPETRGRIPAATAMANSLGYSTHVITETWFMEASEVGKMAAGMGMMIERSGGPFAPPCALIMTGEPVVTVGKGKGVGGRNQELTTAAAAYLAGRTQRVTIGSVDTDGTDGPGGHFDEEATKMGVAALAGGIVDGQSAAKAVEQGYNIVEVLKDHGTSKLLWDIGDGVWTTQSISVQDLTVVLIDAE